MNKLYNRNGAHYVPLYNILYMNTRNFYRNYRLVASEIDVELKICRNLNWHTVLKARLAFARILFCHGNLFQNLSFIPLSLLAYHGPLCHALITTLHTSALPKEILSAGMPEKEGTSRASTSDSLQVF